MSVRIGPTTPIRRNRGSSAMRPAQSGMTSVERNAEEVAPELLDLVDDRHGRILASVRRACGRALRAGCGRRRGLPRFVVAPRPGVHRGSVISSVSSPGCGCGIRGGAGGRELPTLGLASRGRSRRPMSQADPAVRRAALAEGELEVAVVGDDEDLVASRLPRSRTSRRPRRASRGSCRRSSGRCTGR